MKSISWSPIIIHLFHCKYVLVEIELDLLVGDVNAELLKGIDGKVLKAEDIEYGNCSLTVLPG